MKICQFHEYCEGYYPTAATCHNDDEASTYCGHYPKHKAKKREVGLKKLFRIGMLTK